MTRGIVTRNVRSMNSAVAVGRTYKSSPEHLQAGRGRVAFGAVSFGGVLATGLLLAGTSLRLPLICPVRFLTGVPCPLCGMTTGTVATLRGDLHTALEANPFSVGVVPAAAAGLINRVGRIIRPRSPRAWSSTTKRVAIAVISSMLLASWVFELIRFNVL